MLIRRIRRRVISDRTRVKPHVEVNRYVYGEEEGEAGQEERENRRVVA